jgi:DNA-binding transcriptional ArsR family regulator
MVHSYALSLDQTFAALADPSRRGVLERLGQSDATVTELATAFGMTLTGMKKHIGVLERAGLVATEKQGRVRTCRLGTARLEAEAAWLASYRAIWSARFAELDDVLAELKLRDAAKEGPRDI